MDILVKNMEPTQLLDIFNEAGVRFYKNGEPIEFEIFHNDVGPIRHGHWEGKTYKCSLCGKWVDPLQGNADMNYCPNCGARMDEEEQEHE